MPTLRTLSVTDGCELTDADLGLIARITQLESLSMDRLPLPGERLPGLSAFTHLKIIFLALRTKGYPAKTQANPAQLQVK